MIVHAGPFRSDIVWCNPIQVQLDLSRGWGKAKEALPWLTGDICIVWAMSDTVAPAAFIPMTFHRWLMVLFPMTKSNWPVTKSWLLGWPKLCWFQLYCSKTIWSISLIFPRHVTRYILIILTIFQEATQCLTQISLENFCKNFFQGCILNISLSIYIEIVFPIMILDL